MAGPALSRINSIIILARTVLICAQASSTRVWLLNPFRTMKATNMVGVTRAKAWHHKKKSSDGTSDQQATAQQMKKLCVFSVFPCIKGAIDAASRGIPKFENGAPRDEPKNVWAVRYVIWNRKRPTVPNLLVSLIIVFFFVPRPLSF